MMCWNKKTLGLVAVGPLAVLAFAPSAFGRVWPLLFMAACPLGMIGMFLMARASARPCRTDNNGPVAPEARAATDSAETEIVRLRQGVTFVTRTTCPGVPGFPLGLVTK